MLDTVLLAAAALLLGQLAPQAPAAVTAAAAACFALAWARLRRWQALLACACFALGCLGAASALQAYGDARDLAHGALGPPCLCTGTVRVHTSPARRADRYAFLADSLALSCDGQASIAPGTRLRLYADHDALRRGDVVHIQARLGVVEIFRNFEVDGAFAFVARSGALLSGGVKQAHVVQRAPTSFGSWVDAARSHARGRIEATYPPEAAPLARALVLGENDLPDQDAEAFRVSGLSHLLAVSGTHIILAVLGLVRLLEGLLRRCERWAAAHDVGRVAAWVGIPLAWLYADFAGSGGSVRRAALMASVALGARALGRPPDGMRAFGLSLFAGGLLDPLAAYDVSFGLSAGATGGLLVLSRPLHKRIAGLGRPWSWGAGAVAGTVAATACCLPWLAVMSAELSAVGVVANLIAAPIGEAVSLPACLGHLLLAPWPAAERGVALLGSGSLLAVRAVARAGAACPWLSIPVPRPTAWHLAVLGGTCAALLLRPRRRLLAMAVGACLLVVAEIAAFEAGRPRGRVRVTVLDVGQGDSMVVDFPDGRAMVIDGGGMVGSPVDPGIRVVAPALRARRRRHVDIVVLTHPHPDHFLGLTSVVPSISVGSLWDTGQQGPSGQPPAVRRLLDQAQARGIPVHSPRHLCGKLLRFGEASVRVLGPCPDVREQESANDNSYVVRIDYGQHRALLVGDAEAAQERALLALGAAALRADLLKVGHHGSRNATTARFLEAVHPSIAVITSGIRNRHGHPTPETLARLRAHDVRVLRSDLDGAVRWETDGTQWRVETRRGRAARDK